VWVREVLTGLGGGEPEERIHYEELGVNRRTILKWILEK
jgi:hypothetical protein